MITRYIIIVSVLSGSLLYGQRCGKAVFTNPLAAYIQRKFCVRPRDKGSFVITKVPTCIDKPGCYILDRDHCFFQDETNDVAILIDSDGVTIDFQDHTIQLSGPNAIGVAAIDRTDVSLKNGTIAGTQTTSDSVGPTLNVQFGFIADNAGRVRIDGMVFQHLGAGVNVTKTVDVVISNSLFEEGVTGIQAVAFGSGVDPAVVGFVDGLTVKDTHIRAMSQFGIFLRANIRNVLVDGTIIDSVDRDGIFVERNLFLADNFTICGTRISNTGGSGIFAQPLIRNWLIKESQFLKNGRNGMEFDGPRNLEIIASQVFESGLSGIFVGVRAANGVAIYSSQINNAGEIPLRIDNTTNLIVKDVNVINYQPSPMPTVRLVDVIDGTLTNVVITSQGANILSNGLFLRGCIGVQCQGLVVDFNLLPGQELGSLFNQGNAVLFAGGNQNCSLRSSTINSSQASLVDLVIDEDESVLGASGISVSNDLFLEGAQLSGDNLGIVIEDCSIANMLGSGILVTNFSGVTIVNNKILNNQLVGIALNGMGSSVRDNTVMRNREAGIADVAEGNNNIFHNFASDNGTSIENNYRNVPTALVVEPSAGVGALENISTFRGT